MVAQHAGAGAEVRSRVGYFPKSTSVSVDKAIQKRSREHSFVVGLASGMCLGNICARLGILGWLAPVLALLSALLSFSTTDALC